MTAKTRTPKQSRLTRELLETAKDMHANGTMDDAAYRKIRARHAIPNGELTTTNSPQELVPSINDRKPA
jgi:hypothetical protein